MQHSHLSAPASHPCAVPGPDGNFCLRLNTKRLLGAACGVWTEETIDWAYESPEKQYCQRVQVTQGLESREAQKLERGRAQQIQSSLPYAPDSSNSFTDDL